MKARIVNNELAGVYTDEFIVKNANQIINGQLVSEWVLTDLIPDISISKPLWNGVGWVEGLSGEEIQEIQNQKISEYRLKIYDYTEKLFNSSKARALNKIGQGLTKSQLDALEIFYTKKNDVAAQYLVDETVNNESIFELIEFEEANDFSGIKLDNEIDYLNSNYNAQIPTNVSRIKQYCYLIVVKFNLGKQLDEALKSLCEIFRSKLITNLDNLEFEKIDQRIALIQSITNDTSIAEVLALKTPFDAI